MVESQLLRMTSVWFFRGFRGTKGCRMVLTDQERLIPLEGHVGVQGWGSVVLEDQKTLGEGL